MKRRDFLKNTGMSALGASATLGAGGGLFQASKAQAQLTDPSALLANPCLVVIYLRGGQDQLNTVIPYRDDNYYRIRPTISIPKEEVVKLDNMWAFHPALTTLKPFYDQGKVSMVINSGSPHPTRSHFDAQDFMEYAAPGNRTMKDGWLNRYLEATRNPRGDDPSRLRAIAMQERLPRSMRGTYPVVAVPSNLREIDEVLDLFEDFYSGGDAEQLDDLFSRATKKQSSILSKKNRKNLKEASSGVGLDVDPVMSSGMYTIRGLRRLKQLLYGAQHTYGSSRANVEEFSEATFQEYPDQWFASRLKALARLIKSDSGLQVAATDINGWDHHIGMGSLDGTLNRMLTFLSEGLAAFMSDLGEHLDRTLIVVCSEFGRVCRENGNDGSDHGHGGMMWLLGGKLRGGRILGRWEGLDKKDMYQARDLPVSTDFRDIFAEILREHMEFDFPVGFFPDYTPAEKSLGLFA